jgi:hypothetical protein
VFFQEGDVVVSITDPTPNFIPIANPLVAMRAVHTESVPAAVWMTNPPGGGVEVVAGTSAGQTTSLAQCQTDPSFTGYGLHAGLTLDDLWTVSWSKQGTTFASENTVIQCSGSACTDEGGLDPGVECGETTRTTRVNENFRHLLVEAFPDPANPNALYQVILLARDVNSTTSVVIVLNHAVIGGAQTPLGSVTVASAPSDDPPDFPEIAIIPPETIAVSWLEPSAEGGDVAHFARYRICPLIP